MATRAAETRAIVEAHVRNEATAPNLIDGGVLSAEILGQRWYFEADAIAARTGEQLRVGEMKSFPVVDGRTEPSSKASSRQIKRALSFRFAWRGREFAISRAIDLAGRFSLASAAAAAMVSTARASASWARASEATARASVLASVAKRRFTLSCAARSVGVSTSTVSLDR